MNPPNDIKRPNSKTPNCNHFFRSRSRWVHRTHAIGRDPKGMPIAYRVAGSYRKS